MTTAIANLQGAPATREDADSEPHIRRLTGDANHRDGVEHRSGDTGHQVGCAGTAGGDADTDLAGGASIAVGHVGRRLLVTNQDVVDRVVRQRVVRRHDGAAGITEHQVYLERL